MLIQLYISWTLSVISTTLLFYCLCITGVNIEPSTFKQIMAKVLLLLLLKPNKYRHKWKWHDTPRHTAVARYSFILNIGESSSKPVCILTSDFKQITKCSRWAIKATIYNKQMLILHLRSGLKQLDKKGNLFHFKVSWWSDMRHHMYSERGCPQLPRIYQILITLRKRTFSLLTPFTD